MLKQLIGNEPFPDPRDSDDPDDEFNYIAYGGDLSVGRLTEAYSKGIFPYFDVSQPVALWCCPLDRFVIFPSEIHVSHSMRTLLNSGRYAVTFNEDFRGVILGCALADGRLQEEDGAWLGPRMIDAYVALHDAGRAQSVEVWKDGRLAGGLYGVTLHGCFFGESMFSLVPSASKVALINLARKMESEGGKMIDCQFETPHLLSMGGRHISYEEYLGVISGGV